MSDPPTKRKDSFTITMLIPHPRKLVEKQILISPTHACDGLIWSLHVSCVLDGRCKHLMVYIHCEGDGSSELWRTEAQIQLSYEERGVGPTSVPEATGIYRSWKGQLNKDRLEMLHTKTAAHITSISIAITAESESFATRPIHDIRPIPDVTLLLEGQRFPVNKQMLAGQSSYFNNLFFCGYKESKQEEIEIKDTDPEDFHELLKMIQGVSSEPTTVENVIRYLTMADMFDVQIVKDRMENFLLSTDLISIHRKLLIADEHKLKILKAEVFYEYKRDRKLRDLESLANSPEYDELPAQLVKDLLAYVRR